MIDEQSVVKGRILLVDDEEFCLTAMKNMIKKLGVDIDSRVDECITGLEAIRHIRTSFARGINYALIITDFNMPEMDGIEATRLIRNFLSSQKVAIENQPIIIGATGHVEE